MLKLIVHIGLPWCGADQLQTALYSHRAELLRKGVLLSSAAGQWNNTKLYMAVSDPDRPDPLRLAHGYATAAAQDRMRRSLIQDIEAEAQRGWDADVMLFSCPQLATLPTRDALEKLKELLSTVSEDISILAHVEDQARVLLRHYADALMGGRYTDLTQEIALTEGGGGWGKTALESWLRDFPVNPTYGAQCPEVQAVPHWLDYAKLVARWEQVFGPKKVILRSYDPSAFTADAIGAEIRAMLGVKGIRKATNEPGSIGNTPRPSVATLSRWRQINLLLNELAGSGRVVRRQLWRDCLRNVAVEGASAGAGALSMVSHFFGVDNAALCKVHQGLSPHCFLGEQKAQDWTEADPGPNFSAPQQVAALVSRLTVSTSAGRIAPAGFREASLPPGSVGSGADLALTPIADRLFSARAREDFRLLKQSRFSPHNRIGTPEEEMVGPDYFPTKPRHHPEGCTGKVIVACMKNEAPYVLEWVAYHRQIGIDNFLIYTNDCSDGTDDILDRLQELGIVEHRSNNDWTGKSPQQDALNKAMDEPVVRSSDWLTHIDVDEFINVRIGNGTLDDVLARVPEATNVAMTWRLFGNDGVLRIEDQLVIEQFDRAAPKYCPKPHTNWGFKTLTRNIGAYSKLSCHRPSNLAPEVAPRVQWVNGSGRKMTAGYHVKGWRSDLLTIGYDMIQLNHYALRSADGFLIKRQRGRALHTDRSIGLNYWIRMDWSSYSDKTIKRNIPRVRMERLELLQDQKLRQLHEKAVAWHQAKAAELHTVLEFEQLYQQALAAKLTDLERAAFTLSLDTES